MHLNSKRYKKHASTVNLMLNQIVSDIILSIKSKFIVVFFCTSSIETLIYIIGYNVPFN